MTNPVCGLVVILFLGAEIHAQDVNTTHGRVTGLRMSVLGKNVDVYYGIPFAKPPVGEYRFKHPQPAGHWRPEVKDASAMKPSCIQPLSPSQVPLRATPSLMSEDCLYLNVWVPTDVQPGTKLATMVWIYGGSFTSGSINIPLYDGKYLAAENNVIVFSVNYRLGALGFSYLGSDTFPGNQGLMDQALALKWINENTERFGGDRNSITIFGESAGAASVGLHLLSPRSRDYFTRAILQSGVPNAIWSFQTQNVARSNAMAFATASNCSVKSDIETFNCISRLPPESIIETQNNLNLRSILFVPVVDKFFLPELPEVMIKSGNIKKCEILIGNNKDEGTFMLLYALPTLLTADPVTITRSQFLSIFTKDFGENTPVTKALIAQYEGTQVASLRDSYVDLADDILGDYSFKCPAVKFSDSVSKWSKVYMYSFEHIIASLPLPKWMGVVHSFEIEMVFGHPLGDVLTTTQEEKNLSRKIMTYWTTFAKTGNPNSAGSGLTDWPQYNTQDERFLVLDIGTTMPVKQGYRKQECVFFNEILPMILEGSNTQETTTERVVVLPCVSGSSEVKVVSWVIPVSVMSALLHRLFT